MKYDKKTKNRVKRIEGQVRAITRMMEEEQDCQGLVTQITAARNALDRVLGIVVSSNLEKCIREQVEKGEETDASIQEAVNLLVSSR